MTVKLDPALLDPVGTDPHGLSLALEPHGRSRMLPAAAYTSPDVLAWERRHLFAGGWVCLGREVDLRADPAVSQRAAMAGDVSVLLTWEDTGAATVLRAFANTCAHRGHELLADGDDATRQSVLCPYHAWTYDLGGRLRAAPGFQRSPDFDPSEQGLVELGVERWLGWVFCHAASPRGTERRSFADHVGEMGQVLAPYAPQELVLGDRHTYEVAANWKVVAENYHECYHCPLIHPELCQVSPPTSGDNYDLPGAWVGGSMDLREGMQTMSLDGRGSGVPIPGVDPARVEYVHLLPNLLVSAHPDYVMTHRLVPLAPGRTWIECSWLFPAPPGAASVDAAAAAFAVDFWDLTNRQDWAACESVQRGLASPHFRPGPLAPAEDAVHRLVHTIGRAYLGEPI